jgi:single-strand DNA-binding protein
MDLNRASLIGTMATDPNIRMAGDKQVCNFRLVTNWRGKDKQTSEFHTVICWDKLAENVGTFMNKGARLFVEGRLQTREWVTADGQKKATTEIVADQIIFLDKKEYPARSTGQVTNITPKGYSVEDFVHESMDKNEPAEELDLKSIPF